MYWPKDLLLYIYIFLGKSEDRNLQNQPSRHSYRGGSGATQPPSPNQPPPPILPSRRHRSPASDGGGQLWRPTKATLQHPPPPSSSLPLLSWFESSTTRTTSGAQDGHRGTGSASPGLRSVDPCPGSGASGPSNEDVGTDSATASPWRQRPGSLRFSPACCPRVVRLLDPQGGGPRVEPRIGGASVPGPCPRVGRGAAWWVLPLLPYPAGSRRLRP